MAKKKENSKIYHLVELIFILILLIVVIHFGFMKELSIIHIGGVNIEPETRNEIWQEIPIEITSVYFGTIGSGGLKSVCSTNDGGKATLSNSYSIGDLLDLSTSISVNNLCNCGPNFIEVNTLLPPGKLTINCNTVATSDSSGGSESFAKINDKHIVKSSVSYNGCLPRSVSETGKFEEVYDEPTEINLFLSATAKGGGNSYGSTSSCSVRFEETIDLCTGVICEEYINNSIKYYDGSCVEGECVYETEEIIGETNFIYLILFGLTGSLIIYIFMKQNGKRK